VHFCGFRTCAKAFVLFANVLASELVCWMHCSRWTRTFWFWFECLHTLLQKHFVH